MKVIFLDRDGVINKYPGDYKYVRNWKEFHFLSGVKKSIRQLTEAGYKIFIISNQAGVSKGIFSHKALENITKKMLKDIRDSGGDIDGVFYCTHLEEDNCLCRKPKTGLIDKVVAQLKKDNIKVDFSKSFFVGDTIRDVRTGKAAGLKTILLFSGKEKPRNRRDWEISPDFTAKDLKDAVKIILHK
ncbi:MAG: HAD family hydrolase [Candidatus Omnitrophica bacterium]|nr:HAD family hydrolase [Candidatus Omnitrophota bacterium]